MIKFFRIIRQGLLLEHNNIKYFRYAIGEILLVMIGILLALQVNNWNQERLERQEEKVILSNLKDDFKQAITEFEYLNSIRNHIISSAREITSIDVSMLDQYPEHYLDSLLSTTLFGPTFNNKSGSLNVLLTSGKINLVKNQELRRILIEWPGDVEDMIEDEINQDQLYKGPYTDFLNRHISWNGMIKTYDRYRVMRFNEITLDIMPESSIIKSDYKYTFSSMYFLNLLHSRASLCMISNQETIVLIDKAKEIIQLIDNDLK